MLISTKGRYAIRLMIDMAQNQAEGYLPLKSIAERQNISLKYLECIAGALTNKGLIKSNRGKLGGYRLADEPKNLNVGDILTVSQGGITTVECSGGKNSSCEKDCLAMPLWEGLDKVVNDFFYGLSLQDLLSSEEKNIYLIRKDKDDESICR